MFTTSELDNYINEAAHGYLKESKPLNETITKLAADHGLNRDQIARVVEGANTEVYVQMMNQSTDKYVQFDNASAEKIAESVFGTEKAAEYSTEDYEEDPITELSDSNFEKLASVEDAVSNETEIVKQAHRLAALDTRLTDSLYEVDVRFQGHSDVLYNMVKQAYLSGTSFGDIQRAINLTFDSSVVKKVMGDHQEKLAAEIYPTKMRSEQEHAGSVNMNNPIIKQAELLVKDAQEFITLRTKLAEAREEMEKLAVGLPQVKAYFKTVGKAVSGQKVRTEVIKEVVKKAPKQAPSSIALGKAKQLFPANPMAGTAGAPTVKPLSNFQKNTLIAGAGLAGGIGLQSHMEETRRRQAALPMPPGAGRFRV